jgi:hypothetical protein
LQISLILFNHICQRKIISIHSEAKHPTVKVFIKNTTLCQLGEELNKTITVISTHTGDFSTSRPGTLCLQASNLLTPLMIFWSAWMPSWSQVWAFSKSSCLVHHIVSYSAYKNHFKPHAINHFRHPMCEQSMGLNSTSRVLADSPLNF